MDAPAPQPTPEQQVQGYLAMLAQPGLKPYVRDIALKNLARAFIEERTAYAQLEKEAEEQKAELRQQAAELAELRAWKEAAQRFENSLKSIMLERDEPAPQTSAPASPPRLTVVRGEVQP